MTGSGRRRLGPRRSPGPLVAVGLLLAILAAGCGTRASSSGAAARSAAQPVPALPPRSTALPLNGVQLCGLIAGPDAARLGVGPGNPSGQMNMGTAACQWANQAVYPNNTWMVRALPNTAAGSALGHKSGGAQIVAIGGFPAVQTTPGSGSPDRGCVLWVDVADHQTLMVDYLDGSGDDPAMNHAMACQRASQAAQMMVTRLKTLTVTREPARR